MAEVIDISTDKKNNDKRVPMVKYNPNIHHRRSIRLAGYDYSQKGYYFITICAQGRKALFGTIKNNQMIPNGTGQMIQMFWDEIAQYYDGIEIDAFQIMPNHIHGIIIVGAGPRACPNNDTEQSEDKGQSRGLSLGDVVARFKSITTNEYIHDIKQNKQAIFDWKLWQRNYYERIIRDEQALINAREYIINNPCNWNKDELYMEL
jgi:putative transposase